MKRVIKKTIILTFVLFLPQHVLAERFNPDTIYQACFTPGQACTNMITEAIESAKSSVYVQAYSFTSVPIAKAILEAKRRGLDVIVILDKSQIKNNRYSSSKFLMNNNVPVYIDYKPAIAHNKVIIIDNKILVTGSFNFTQAAQYKNAENVLIISDKNLAKKYLIYWRERFTQSMDAKEYLEKI